MSKEATLEICPTAICKKKDSGEWGVYEAKNHQKPVVLAKTAAQAWKEAYMSLDPNYRKIPYRIKMKKDEKDEWYIDALNDSWQWVDISDKRKMEDCIYCFDVDQYSGSLGAGKFFWGAYAQDKNPMYYRLSNERLHILLTECEDEMLSVIRQLKLNAYREVVSKQWLS